MATEADQDILGIGWSLPPQTDVRGGIAFSRHERDIEESIQIILGTAKGERRMRPNFGCDINTLIFSPNNATTWGLASRYIEDALGWWEPRIEVIEINTRPFHKDAAQLLITIKYRVKATNDKRTLVYPFYLLPGRA